MFSISVRMFFRTQVHQNGKSYLFRGLLELVLSDTSDWLPTRELSLSLSLAGASLQCLSVHRWWQSCLSVPKVKIGWLDSFIFKNFSFMMGLEIFRIYLQRGKYDPAIVFLKARVGKGLHLVAEQRELKWWLLLFTVCAWRRSSTLLFQHFVGSLVSTRLLGGELSCSVNIRASDLMGVRGTSRWAELNAASQSRCCFLHSHFHPTPFPKLSLFIYLVPATFLLVHVGTEYRSAAGAPEF